MDATQTTILLAVLAMLAFFALVVLAVFALLAGPWLRAWLHGAPVPVFQVIAMRLRGNPPNLLIDAYIALKRAGLPASIADVENKYIDARNRVLTSDDLVELMKNGANAH
jgi:uncharacterized protein YqfA (UPF0365 family)